MSDISDIPLSIYVHIPWCEQKCPYCDFNSHVSASGLPEKDYVECLSKDLETQLGFVQGRKIHSIFFGGGTPSLFSVESIHNILSLLREKLAFADDIEVTLEANPGSSERAKFEGFLRAGVNRLSIGVQSFEDEKLKSLGRIHSSQEAIKAIEEAKSAGFTRFNIDLMFGLPEQSHQQALADLQQALSLGAEHISWYQLTIEQNTAFFNAPPALPDDEQLLETHQAGIKLLEQQGFEQYEVSAFAKPGQHSIHNLNYWQFGDYLAIGAGAHGKVSELIVSSGGQKNISVSRYANTRLPKDYLARVGHYRAQHYTVEEEELLFEVLMNGLRLKQGVLLDQVSFCSGLPEQQLLEQLEPFISRGLLSLDKKRLKATEQGFWHLDSILSELV